MSETERIKARATVGAAFLGICFGGLVALRAPAPGILAPREHPVQELPAALARPRAELLGYPLSGVAPWSLAPAPEMGELWAESITVGGRIEGPVAGLSIHRVYAHRSRRSGPGVEVTDSLHLPPTAALHSFWITENGKRIEGAVRPRGEARADYQATVRRSRDPGLLEWTQEGRVSFSLFPVLPDGTPKDAAWSQDMLLSANPERRVELPLSLGRLPIRRLEIRLEVHEPGGVSAWHLPGGLTVADLGTGHYRLEGVLENRQGREDVVLAWTLAGPARGIWKLSGGGFAARLVESLVPDEGVPLVVLGKGEPGLLALTPRGVDGQPAGMLEVALDAVSATLEVAPELRDRLMIANAMTRLHHAGVRPGEVATLALRERMVGPHASLYAKPGLERDATAADLSQDPGAAPEGALPSGNLPSPADPAPSGWLASGPDAGLSLPSVSDFGLPFVPNFKAARERANFRACFANQKTIAGALEMYNLDRELTLPRTLEGPWRRGRNWRLGSFAAGDPGGTELPVELAHWRTWVPMVAPPEPTPGAEVPEILFLPEIADTLKDQGYLQSIPTDPGAPRGPGGDPRATAWNYLFLSTSGEGVFCLYHGAIRGEGSARQQLHAMGLRDPDLLARAAPVRHAGPRPWKTHEAWAALFAALMAVWSVLAVLRGLWASVLPPGSEPEKTA